MPKLNVYVSESLGKRIREAGIAVSATCQRALEEEVRRVEATLAANERVRLMAQRLKAGFVSHRPDDLVRETEGHAVGVHWATHEATLAELSSVANANTPEVLVNRRSGSLDRVLSDAGFSTDSETNRTLTVEDPWCRGFLRACQEMWREVQPLM
jgi:post-segregation antitoxin (ccd killing protein)